MYQILRKSTERSIGDKLIVLENELIEKTRCPEEKQSEFRRNLRYFKSDFKKKWKASNSMEERFFMDNKNWLNSSIRLPTWKTIKAGRPVKNFEESCDRSKRRKTKELREQIPVNELTYAVCKSQRVAGNHVVSRIIKDITVSPTRAEKFRACIANAETKTVKKLSPSQALSIFVHANLSRKQYEIIQGANKNIYPCYSLLKKAKVQCYPKEESINVTETSVEIKLQDLLDHTVSRLCTYLQEVFNDFTEGEKRNLELITKWGCDGSQQAEYKQKFQNDTDNDAHIFLSSLVPIRLIVNVDGDKKIIWQNPSPSSPRYCRPIRIRFIRETKDTTKEEIQHIENQIRNLIKTEVSQLNGVSLSIKHILLLTMVDGKVCNAATNTSSTMRCYICGETSKNFNNLTKKREENPETFKFGLSILHTRIRFFEFLLHLSYKLPIQKWQARNEEDKLIVSEKKRSIQKTFREEMGLLVDVPKAGFGNTNDGNTSRRFFAEPEVSARITGLSVNVIRRFKVILEAISSGFAIDINKFSSYLTETAHLYINLYNWHPMSPTVHKILVHGATVISHALLPIGQLSEEAAEARNKHFRHYRQNFSRKFSRKACNRDIINRLLLNSDPFITSSQSRPKKRSQSFSSEALALFCPEDVASVTEDGTRNEEEKSESELEDYD